MENFQAIWKLSRHSGNFPDNLVTCKKYWKLSRPSILSRLYKKFPDKTKIFQTIQKHSRQSKNFPDNPETSVIFQTSYGYNRQKYVQCKKFPDAQKLSGEQCSRAPYVFLSMETLQATNA